MPSLWSQDLYIKAYRFAAEAHWKRKQVVPGTDIPYLMHFNLVAMEVLAALAVNSYLDGDLAVQCALLHDAIEDTDVTLSELTQNFGQKVADGVSALTKDKRINANLGEWDKRKLQMTDCLRRIKTQPREIWMVKMADRITNLQPPPRTWTQEMIHQYKDESILIYNSLIEGSAFLAERLKEKIVFYLCPDIF